MTQAYGCLTNYNAFYGLSHKMPLLSKGQTTLGLNIPSPGPYNAFIRETTQGMGHKMPLSASGKQP